MPTARDELVASARAAPEWRGYNEGMTTQPTYQESKRLAEASRDADWKQPSFGRELFMGNLQLELIHPQPELPAHSVEGRH